MTAMADERLISGCVGADRPEAQPYIPEVDGVLYSTCPERRKAVEELELPQREWSSSRPDDTSLSSYLGLPNCRAAQSKSNVAPLPESRPLNSR